MYEIFGDCVNRLQSRGRRIISLDCALVSRPSGSEIRMSQQHRRHQHLQQYQQQQEYRRRRQQVCIYMEVLGQRKDVSSISAEYQRICTFRTCNQGLHRTMKIMLWLLWIGVNQSNREANFKLWTALVCFVTSDVGGRQGYQEVMKQVCIDIYLAVSASYRGSFRQPTACAFLLLIHLEMLGRFILIVI